MSNLPEHEIHGLAEIQEEQNQWARKNFGEDRPFWGPLLGAGEELGELNHAALKNYQGIRSMAQNREAEMDAVGDVIIYLMDFCNIRGYDLATIIEDTWNQVSQRDWKNRPETG